MTENVYVHLPSGLYRVPTTLDHGQMVFVRDSSNEDWSGPYVLHAVHSESESSYPFRTSGGPYAHAIMTKPVSTTELDQTRTNSPEEVTPTNDDRGAEVYVRDSPCASWKGPQTLRKVSEVPGDPYPFSTNYSMYKYAKLVHPPQRSEPTMQCVLGERVYASSDSEHFDTLTILRSIDYNRGPLHRYRTDDGYFACITPVYKTPFDPRRFHLGEDGYRYRYATEQDIGRQVYARDKDTHSWVGPMTLHEIEWDRTYPFRFGHEPWGGEREPFKMAILAEPEPIDAFTTENDESEASSDNPVIAAQARKINRLEELLQFVSDQAIRHQILPSIIQNELRALLRHRHWE